MFRRTMLGSMAAVLLSPALLVVAEPAQAVRHDEWGRLGAADGVLRKGCRPYDYRYTLRPPEGDWALEVFLADPRGRRLGSAVLLAGHDPVRGTRRITICRGTTKPGRFVLRGRLSVQNGPDEYVEGWIRPVAFKLRARR